MAEPESTVDLSNDEFARRMRARRGEPAGGVRIQNAQAKITIDGKEVHLAELDELDPCFDPNYPYAPAREQWIKKCALKGSLGGLPPCSKCGGGSSTRVCNTCATTKPPPGFEPVTC